MEKIDSIKLRLPIKKIMNPIARVSRGNFLYVNIPNPARNSSIAAFNFIGGREGASCIKGVIWAIQAYIKSMPNKVVRSPAPYNVLV